MAAITFGGVGLRTGSFGRGRRAVQWSSMTAQCSSGGAFHHWLRPSLRSVLGFVGGAEWLTMNLELRTAGPHLYLLRSVTGPASHGWLGAHDEGAR
jgi:hypothetical protein